MFAYQTEQQPGFFWKDLIPLAAIGRAYARSQKSEVWRAGGKNRIKPEFATCKNQPIFEAVKPTGLLLERVDEALRGHR